MDRSAIPKILKELNLNEEDVACIYNYGSWVYGTNKPTSDRDLMVVTRASKPPLTFYEDFDYFHDFELSKLWNQYDVCIHSVDNFKTLLEKNYLLAIECIFLPDEFKIKEEIDFRSLYLDTYYDQVRLKKVAFYENFMSTVSFDPDADVVAPARSTTWDQEDESGRTYLFKNLFHGFRYLDVAEQLITTRKIHDFRRVSHVFNEMQEIRGDPTQEENMMEVLEYTQGKSSELKSQLDKLVPTNVVKGTFEAHVTFECSHETEQVIEALKRECENSKFKIIFIEFNTTTKGKKGQQLMTSSYHCGEYPSIVQQIENEVHEKFAKFNIVRIKIESLASNQGVPETKMDKLFFWNKETNYFEFHYKITVKTQSNKDKLDEIRSICRRFYSAHLHLSRNAFKKVNENESHYMITVRLFSVGRVEAFAMNEQIITFLTSNRYPPSKVEREFVVHDSHIALDNAWE